MDVSLKKYRIIKKNIIENKYDVKEVFYPQYKTRLFGWRYFLNESDLMSIAGASFFTFMLSIFGSTIFISGLIFIWMSPLIGLCLMLGPVLCWGITLWLMFKTTYIKYEDMDTKNFHSLENAKNYIEKLLKNEERRINAINKKKNLDEEVYFMNIKIERYHKLNKLKNRLRI